MSRLTFKHRDFYLSQAPCTDDLALKLGKLEDLEDELCCPLDVVFKALKQNEIWVKGNYFSNVDDLDLTYSKVTDWVLVSNTHEMAFTLKGYKKTWWLKEDLSE